jgi:hypothetical protein
MTKSRFNEEQIIPFVREQEAGMKTVTPRNPVGNEERSREKSALTSWGLWASVKRRSLRYA